MNSSYFTDLLPSFCASGSSNKSKLQAVQTACALQQTDKSLYASIVKDSFWKRLSIGGNYEMAKHQFQVLSKWVKNDPSLTHELVNAISIINHPYPCHSKLKVISIASKIHLYPLLHKNKKPSDFNSIFTPESKKFFTCVAHSEDFLVINKDDSKVKIYKNKKHLSTFEFEGIIQQMEIRNDCLYILGFTQNGPILTLLNLNSSICKTLKIPLEWVTNACFGQSHVVITNLDSNTTTLLTASYKDLLNFSNDCLWLEKTMRGQITLFENGNRFTCLNFKKYHAFDIGELTCSNGDLDYQMIEPGITILQSSFGVYLRIDCIQGRIFASYNEFETNQICTYDIESKKMSHYKLPDGPGFYTLLPLPSFIATTPLKIHYLSFPFENDAYNIQKISIFSLDYSA